MKKTIVFLLLTISSFIATAQGYPKPNATIYQNNQGQANKALSTTTATLIDGISIPAGLLSYPGDKIEYSFLATLDSAFYVSVRYSPAGGDSVSHLYEGNVNVTLTAAGGDTGVIMKITGYTTGTAVAVVQKYWHGFNLGTTNTTLNIYVKGYAATTGATVFKFYGSSAYPIHE